MRFILALLVTVAAMPSWSKSEKVTVHVNGMVCDFCAQGIRKQFKTESAVQNVTVDLDKKVVVLELKESEKLTDESIKTKLKDAGYDVTGIDRG